MTTTVEAIYEQGKLTLPQALPLPEKSRVRVTIDTRVVVDAARSDWLKLSESALLKAWDNSEDEVFNELLSK